MDNTEKLLRAFIEASGYEIELKETFDEILYMQAKADYNNYVRYGGAGQAGEPQKSVYTSIDYKVTKKVLGKF